MTSSNPKFKFEEAEEKRGVIVACTGAICAALAWLFRGSPPALGVTGALAVYLLTGNRYQWIYIWKKTFSRDTLACYILLSIMYKLWRWERGGSTVVSIWEENVRRFPNKRAIIMGDRVFTFKQADEYCNRVSHYFKRQNFKKGEVIALYMDTQPEYGLIWLGLAKLGVITALINSNLKGAQLLHCFKVASCKAIIFGDEMSSAMKEIREDLQGIPLFQFNSPEREEATILEDSVPLAAELRDMPSDLMQDRPSLSAKDVVLYIYTSGTTGLPKAAVIPHIRYLMITLAMHGSARTTSSDVVYAPLPLHHTAGGVLGLGQALISGCTVVIRQKFSATNYWKDAAKYGCTVGQYIGEICRYLLATQPGPQDKAHNIRVMIGNGLRPQIWEQFVERFNIKRVVEFYGATEGNSNLVNLDSKVGAVGFLSRFFTSVYPLILVKCDEVTGEMIRDDNNRCIQCGPMEPGLLLGKIDSKKAIRGFSGYADKEASEKKIVKNVKIEGDCYFNTGDVFYMDHFGYIYFKDRTGDTFRWRGENVSTSEVEGIISTLVGLKDSIVYGVAVPNVEGKAGMVAIADPDKKLDLESLANGLKTSLPPYARPLFVRILPEPPLTSTFKLKKRELLEQGFNPQNHQDEMYFLDQKTWEYVPLTQKLYDDIVNGVVRL